MYKSKSKGTDKSTLFFIFMAISNVLTGVFGAWAIIEFLLYLVKDDPFNWTSLWAVGISLTVIIFFFVRTFIAAMRE